MSATSLCQGFVRVLVPCGGAGARDMVCVCSCACVFVFTIPFTPPTRLVWEIYRRSGVSVYSRLHSPLYLDLNMCCVFLACWNSRLSLSCVYTNNWLLSNPVCSCTAKLCSTAVNVAGRFHGVLKFVESNKSQSDGVQNWLRLFWFGSFDNLIQLFWSLSASCTVQFAQYNNSSSCLE